MALFGKKKEQPAASTCPEGCTNCAPGNTAKEETAASEGPSVKILGSGCAKCSTLEASTKAALAQLGMDTSIDHVTDFAKIAAYGVMTTPALVVDGKVVSFGKCSSPMKSRPSCAGCAADGSRFQILDNRRHYGKETKRHRLL